MTNLSVNLSDYAEGFGTGPESELGDLQKALQAGAITGRETTNLTNASGSPLKVESLENTLKILTFKESDIVLWKNIPKLPAYNTVEEFNQLQDVGTQRGGFVEEGELSETEDSIYVRKANLVKYIRTTREVTHPMQLVNTMIGDVMKQEIKNGTMWILRKANLALAFGNSAIVPAEFDGLYKQHQDAFSSLDAYYTSTSVKDLRGKSLREADVEDGMLSIIDNFGEASQLFGPPKVITNYVKAFYSKKLISPGQGGTVNMISGQSTSTIQTSYGAIDLKYDKFLKSAPAIRSTSSATSTKAPNAPVADGTTPKSAATNTATKFSGFNGDYWYAVTAVNKYGESAPAVLGNAKLAVAGTEAVSLFFTDGGGTYAATGYTIYRSKVNPSTALGATDLFPLFSISTAQFAAGYDGGAAGVVIDLNRILPDTDCAFLIEPDLDIWSFKQLAPLMKMDLAQIGPSSRFMVMMYGTPVLYAPKKITKFINVGSDLT